MAARHATRPDEPLAPGTAVADVHAHTRRSDGVLEPMELVRQAHAAGIRLFAIADHDTLAGYRELTAHGADPLPDDLDLVPAVEINAVTRGLGLDLPEGELHVLGIGVDPADDAFEAAIAAQRGARRARFTATVDRLRAIGLPLDAHLDPAVLESDDALGRPTLARALVAAGFAESVEGAFLQILGHGRPGYVPRTGMGPVEAIRAIRGAGGLASLAHFPEAPTRLPLMRELMAEGLDGLETHHRSFDAETRSAMSVAATHLGLVETGGSDYHGDLGPYAETHALLVMPDDLVANLRVAIARTRGGSRYGTPGTPGAPGAPGVRGVPRGPATIQPG
ncbi:MAG TPA: PHP domain-containing protein [Candidatus Limnocylindrales bacterium]